MSSIFRKVLLSSGADVDEDLINWEDLRHEALEAASAKSAAAQEVRKRERGDQDGLPSG